MDVFCRREIKYLIADHQRAALEAAIGQHMAPDRFPHSSIRNIYYDTPDFRLIRHSLEHPVYKEKLRIRCYDGGAGDVFLEMKKKYKGIVYKRRLMVPQDQALAFLAGQADLPDGQISRELTYFRDFYQNLQPQVFLSYERDSWYGKEDSGLRLTMDRDIYYRAEDLRLDGAGMGEAILDPGWSLMEVKAENAIPLWLTMLLAQLKINKVSFSKYGRAYEQQLRRAIQEKRGYLYVGQNIYGNL